jgi:hypothetical protein
VTVLDASAARAREAPPSPLREQTTVWVPMTLPTADAQRHANNCCGGTSAGTQDFDSVEESDVIMVIGANIAGLLRSGRADLTLSATIRAFSSGSHSRLRPEPVKISSVGSFVTRKLTQIAEQPSVRHQVASAMMVFAT